MFALEVDKLVKYKLEMIHGICDSAGVHTMGYAGRDRVISRAVCPSCSGWFGETAARLRRSIAGGMSCCDLKLDRTTCRESPRSYVVFKHRARAQRVLHPRADIATPR